MKEMMQLRMDPLKKVIMCKLLMEGEGRVGFKNVESAMTLKLFFGTKTY